jgi:branched-chain amino acid transport system substrate-binding protein
MRLGRIFGLAVVLASLSAGGAWAQIKIGAIISITGPTAALGVGYRNAFATFPTEIAGKSVSYIIRDDASDASAAVTIAQRMIEEDHIDALIGPSLTSSAAAVQPIVNAAKVPAVVTHPRSTTTRRNTRSPSRRCSRCRSWSIRWWPTWSSAA